MKKTILITGGAGFIGSNLCKFFIKKDFEVITIDNLSTGFKENIPNGVQFIEGNCQDPEVIFSLKNKKIDAIFHISGQSSGEISFDNPIYDLESNTSSTILLLELAVLTNCNKFYYASTMSTYGYHGNNVVSEDFNQVPVSFYGVGKLASENYLRLYQQRGINSVALRLFTVYGPGQNLSNLRQGMVSIFLAQAYFNKKIQIKGSLERYRDFVYIDDVINAFVKSYEKNLTGYNFFNVSTNKKTTVKELIHKIQSLFEDKIEYFIEGSTEGDIQGIFGDNNKIKKLLNWEPKFQLDDGLKLMFEWIKNERA